MGNSCLNISISTPILPPPPLHQHSMSRKELIYRARVKTITVVIAFSQTVWHEMPVAAGGRALAEMSCSPH